jgi:uncharacterized protein YbcV (DUF1398 family)
MNAHNITALAKATLDGSMPFPDIVDQLMGNGVAYYRVDYVTCTMAFYSAAGTVVTAPITFEHLPLIANDFDAPALKAAIVDSQQHGQKFRVFCARAMQAGVHGYTAYLRGQRLVYFGHQGDQHVEWFPGAEPTQR